MLRAELREEEKETGKLKCDKIWDIILIFSTLFFCYDSYLGKGIVAIYTHNFFDMYFYDVAI